MGQEPLKNPDNKVMAIIGWLLGWLGGVILIVTKKDEPELQMIGWQSLIWGFLCYLPLINIVALLMLIVGLIKALTGNVWESPGVGGFARKKAYPEGGASPPPPPQ